MKNKGLFDLLTQFALPGLTISAQIAIALKYPKWGLVISMVAQPFWMYSGWKAYKESGQIGLFITTIILTIVVALGLINYWIL